MRIRTLLLESTAALTVIGGATAVVGGAQAADKVVKPAPVQYVQGGYEASFGTYEIDEPAHHFIFHVEGALVRSLIGKDLTRVFEFSGKQLIVKSSDPDEHWRVAWEHY